MSEARGKRNTSTGDETAEHGRGRSSSELVTSVGVLDEDSEFVAKAKRDLIEMRALHRMKSQKSPSASFKRTLSPPANRPRTAESASASRGVPEPRRSVAAAAEVSPPAAGRKGAARLAAVVRTQMAGVRKRREEEAHTVREKVQEVEEQLRFMADRQHKLLERLQISENARAAAERSLQEAREAAEVAAQQQERVQELEKAARGAAEMLQELQDSRAEVAVLRERLRKAAAAALQWQRAKEKGDAAMKEMEQDALAIQQEEEKRSRRLEAAEAAAAAGREREALLQRQVSEAEARARDAEARLEALAGEAAVEKEQAALLGTKLKRSEAATNHLEMRLRLCERDLAHAANQVEGMGAAWHQDKLRALNDANLVAEVKAELESLRTQHNRLLLSLDQHLDAKPPLNVATSGLAAAAAGTVSPLPAASPQPVSPIPYRYVPHHQAEPATVAAGAAASSSTAAEDVRCLQSATSSPAVPVPKPVAAAAGQPQHSSKAAAVMPTMTDLANQLEMLRTERACSSPAAGAAAAAAAEAPCSSSGAGLPWLRSPGAQPSAAAGEAGTGSLQGTTDSVVGVLRQIRSRLEAANAGHGSGG